MEFGWLFGNGVCVGLLKSDDGWGGNVYVEGYICVGRGRGDIWIHTYMYIGEGGWVSEF